MSGRPRRIFISYRREDSEAYAGWLATTLRRGSTDEVFLDVDKISLGEDFTSRLQHEIAQCDVVLVLIGPRWLEVVDESGRARIFDDLDWVHLEVRTALERDVPVVPLLLSQARMPRPEQLPPALSALARRHGTVLRADRWEADVEDLQAALPRPAPPPLPQLPSQVLWTEVTGVPLAGGQADVGHVLERWRKGGDLIVPLGRHEKGTASFDLMADGPHALIAGTTGSGKTELLRTLVASLALGNSPEEVTFLLVDLWGGAFGDCERLPHVAGVLRRLDASMVERAGAGLLGELRRREAVLASAGAAHVEDYRRRRSADDGPLPRLVVVVDEFASVAAEQPHFMDVLVEVGQRGRSLGVHLVLGTQRPRGVLTDVIRASTNLRIGLRMNDEHDSLEVLGTAEAAVQHAQAPPGRAFLRSGQAAVVPFQTALVDARRPGGSDLALLVEACHTATQLLDLTIPGSLWVEPLPSMVLLDDLPVDDDPDAPTDDLLPLPYGLLDLVLEQRRAVLALDLNTSAHLLVVGARGSGRTTALRTLAASAAKHAAAADVHIYALEPGGHALSDLRSLPHVAAVVQGDDLDLGARVLEWLVEEVERRAATLARIGARDLREQRAAAPPPERLPRLLLLVDGLDGLVERYEARDAGRSMDYLRRLLRDGPTAGVHAVVTSSVRGIGGALGRLLDGQRLALHLDEADSMSLGLQRLQQADPPVPGRGWLMGPSPKQVQVAALTASPMAEDQRAALRQLAEAVAANPAHAPYRFAPLPRVVPQDALPPPPGPLDVPLGLSGDDPQPYVVHLAEEPAFSITGPRRSGRSTALVLFARALASGGHRAVGIAPLPSPLRAEKSLSTCLTSDGDAGRLLDLLAAGDCVLLIDDAEQLRGTELGTVLEVAAPGSAAARAAANIFVAAADADGWAAGFSGFIATMRKARTGVVLSPQGFSDGELLGARIPRSAIGLPVVPGRGWISASGRLQAVQLALPSAAS